MKKIILSFILYSLFFSTTFGQNLYLNTKGNDSISQTYLKKNSFHSTSFKNLNDLKKETLKIKSHLFNIGYFNSNYSPLKKTNDSTYLLNILLNKKYDTLQINYPSLITHKELSTLPNLKTLSITNNHFICKTKNLKNNINTITQYLADSGKTFTTLNLTNIRINKNTVYANLTISNTQKNTLSNIVIKGYTSFPKKYIKHYLKIKPNQTLHISELKKKAASINNLPFASQIKKPEILFLKDSTTLYLYLKKIKSNSFDGYLGFNSNNENKKIELNGNINIKLINNLNTGEEVDLKYLSTADKQKKINLKLKLPYLFNFPISIESELDIFKKDSSYSTNKQSLKLNYNLLQQLNVGIGIRNTTSNTLNNNINHLNDYKKTAFLTTLNHSIAQQNSLFKIKHKTTLEITLAQRKTTKNTPQQTIHLTSAHIFNLNPKKSIYLKNESFYLNSKEVLDNEKILIGGINSIRGYQENSIPSYIFSYLSTEYRIQLNKTLYTHTILDYGINKNNKNFDNLFGFGIGFGLKNNNNLLQFAFANSKTNKQKVSFSNSKIHLSLKTSF